VPAPAPAAGAAIEAALNEVAVRLHANELPLAVVAIERLLQACQEAARAGLDDVTRTQLQPLVEQCLALAGKSRAGLSAELANLGAGSRAQRAYGAD
jgi:hypothetical protein